MFTYHKDALSKGIVNMLVASFFFALTGATARYLSDVINPVQLTLIRNIIGVVFITYSIIAKPLRHKGGKLGLLLFRGIIGTLALLAFFYSISTIGLALSITYQQSYPVFLAIFSIWIFKEKLNQFEWISIIIGFLGICLIFLPAVTLSNIEVKSHSIGIANAIMTGMGYLSIRGLNQYYENRAIVMSFMLSGIIIPLIILFSPRFVNYDSFGIDMYDFDPITSHEIFPVIVLGVSALVGQIFLTKAFSSPRTGLIGAVGFSNILFSIFFGVLLGDQLPSTLAFLGIGCITLCGVSISYMKVKLEKSKM